METAAALAIKSRTAGSHILRLRLRQIGYALGAAVVSAFASSLVSGLVDGGQGAAESIRSVVKDGGVTLFLALALIVAPLVETLILGWILLLCLDRGINRHVAVFLSATLWTVIHSFDGPSGLSVFFPFIAYSYLFIERRDPPHSDGYFLSMMAHFFFNLFAVIAAHLSGALSG